MGIPGSRDMRLTIILLDPLMLSQLSQLSDVGSRLYWGSLRVYEPYAEK